MDFLRRINSALKNKIVFLITQMLLLFIVIIIGLEYKTYKTKELLIFMESKKCHCQEP